MRTIATLFVLAMLLATPVFAAPKTEVALGGEYVKFDDPDAHDGNSYVFDAVGSVLFGVGKSGWMVVGPTMGVSSDDFRSRLGAQLEFNFMGQAAVTLFAGGRWEYFVKSRDEGGQDSLAGIGGLKFALGKGAALKIATIIPISGIGADETDQAVTATVIARIK